MEALLKNISACRLCAEQLGHKPRPVVQASPQAKILIIGQAPGRRVHESGIPWNDPSGKRLREWLGVDDETFYNPDIFAIMPMGFCFPGTGKSGDLPPRPECAPAWHKKLLAQMPHIEVTILIGQYAQNAYLKEKPKTLTDTIKAWERWQPETFVLPHPSPRNQFWLKKNPWFVDQVISVLRKQISLIT